MNSQLFEFIQYTLKAIQLKEDYLFKTQRILRSKRPRETLTRLLFKAKECDSENDENHQSVITQKHTVLVCWPTFNKRLLSGSVTHT